MKLIAIACHGFTSLTRPVAFLTKRPDDDSDADPVWDVVEVATRLPS
jgi:hypothetical protein